MLLLLLLTPKAFSLDRHTNGLENCIVLSTKRDKIRIVIGVIIGHCRLKKHLTTVCILRDHSCACRFVDDTLA